MRGGNLRTRNETKGDEPGADLAILTRGEQAELKGAGRLFVVSDAIWIVQAWLIAALAASFVDPDGGAGGFFMMNGHAIWLFPLLVAGLALFRIRLSIKGAKRAAAAARAVKTRVRTQILKAITSASPTAPLPASGAVAAHIGDQVDALGPYLSQFYPQKIRLAFVPLMIVAAVAAVSWLAALALLLAGPLIPLFMALIGMRAKAASEAQQAELTRMSGVLLDRIRGLETIRLFGAIRRTEEHIASVGDAFRQRTMKVLRIAFLSSTVLELFSALGIAFVAVFVGFSLLGDISVGSWGSALSFQSGLFILLLAPEFFAPLRGYAAAYHERAAGLAAEQKLSELYRDIGQQAGLQDNSPAPVQTAGTVAKVECAPSIEFAKVGLTLGARPILSDLTFLIEPREHVLLTGPSGAGKTTILDCLLGLHRPQTGSILIDGRNLDTFELESWRHSIAWIGQAPRLFHGSLRANLLRGNPHGNEADMWEALQIAGARDLVERLPHGLGTIIGEEGFGLSVGEMRRIGVARAAMRKDALLVLADEPTAGLDRETAADVIRGLLDMGQGRTLVAATHDPRFAGRGFREIAIRPVRVTEAVA